MTTNRRLSIKPPLSKRKRLVFGLIALLLATIVMLLLGEITLRLFGFPTLPPLGPDLGGDFDTKKISDNINWNLYALDWHLGYRNRANVDCINRQTLPNPRVTTDRLGYRTTWGWSEEADTPIVYLSGDSFVIAAEVPDDKTQASILARRLGVRVLNGGVRGYNTVQSLRLLEETLDRFPEIEVVVHTYCANDLDGSMLMLDLFTTPPTANLDDQGQLVFIEVPYLHGEEGGPILESAIPEYSLSDKVATYSALYLACRSLWRRLPLERAKPDGRHFLTEEESAYWGRWAHRNGCWKVAEKLLLQMKEMCERRGVKFLATCYASNLPGDTMPQQFEAMCNRAGIPHAPLYPYFTDPPETYHSRRIDSEGNVAPDIHYNEKGTRTFADALEEPIKELLEADRNEE